jgi:hypothetical protein
MGADIMTDLAFCPDGKLWAISSTGLYRIDPNTGAATFVESHGIPVGNALTCSTDGTLYAAGNMSTSLYTINTFTGAITALPGDLGMVSDGDLAFDNGTLYLIGLNDDGQVLARISLGSTISATPVATLSLSGVAWAMDMDSTGRLIVAANQSLYQINPINGAASLLSSYTGHSIAMGATAPMMPTDSDRIFNYGESAYSQYINPAQQSSSTIQYGGQTYYFRYYPGTGAYVGTANGHLYYYGPASGFQLHDLGTVTSWLSAAEAAGY